MSFTYKAPDAAPTTRTVDPVKVHIADGQWYLQGWCHLRQAMRTFHLDRVSDLELTDIAITHAEEPVPGWFDADAGDVVARIRFAESVAPLLGEYLDRAAVESADGVGRGDDARGGRVQPAAARRPPRRRGRDPRAGRRAARRGRLGRGRARAVPLSRGPCGPDATLPRSAEGYHGSTLTRRGVISWATSKDGIC